MTSYKIFKLAEKFEKIILAQGAEISQEGTTELFFGNEGNQARFATSAQDAVQNILMNYWDKSQKSSSFLLKAVAEPKKGAQFVLVVQPAMIRGVVSSTLDKVFKSIVGESMGDRQKKADQKAKSGAGSGALKIASLEVGD